MNKFIISLLLLLLPLHSVAEIGTDSVDVVRNSIFDPPQEEKVFFYHKDHLGSTLCITDRNGQIVERAEHIPYGEVFVDNLASDAEYETPYKFTGKEFDEETGLYYYGARFLHPKYVTWLSVDPLATRYPNVSPYVYCHGTPVTLVDPDGRDIIPTLVYGWDYNGNVMKTDYKSTNTFIKAMTLFGKTTYGNKFIASFLPKGKAQYGVKGQGQYASYILQLTEANCANETDQIGVLGGSVNSKVLGFFRVSEIGHDANKSLCFNMAIDVKRSYEDIIATIVHELALHGSALDAIVQAYQEGGFDKAIETYNSLNIDDHKNLKDHNKYMQDYRNYESTKNEIIEMAPSTKHSFNSADQRAQEQY